jgi:hypothetical protein
MTTTQERYVPIDEPIEAKVARLDERTFNLGQSMAKVETETTSQSAKLDILIADLHARKGAEQQTTKFGRIVLGLFAIGGPLGAVWAYFHGK